MTTGTIIFLVLIAALVLVFGAVILWHCCNIKHSIDQSEINRRTEFEEVKSAIDTRISATPSAASREPTCVARIARGRTAAVRDPSDSDTAGPGS